MQDPVVRKTPTLDQMLSQIHTKYSFSEYQQSAMQTRLSQANLDYALFGLAGEVGEVLNKYKKVIRGDYPLEDIKDGLRAELGDILWYVSAIATDLGFDLGEIAEGNIKKLHDRKQKGTLQGSGDER